MSTILATQLTAIGTLALAVLALAAAIAATGAWAVQARQLRVARAEFAGQMRVNAKQTEVLDLQAQELAASLQERKAEAERRQRELAEAVNVWIDSTGVGRMKNTGTRAVRDVTSWWGSAGGGRGDDQDLVTLLPPAETKAFRPNVDLSEDPWCIVKFRTAMERWWYAGSDGFLVPILTAEEISRLE
jgi:hypothetical protein